MNKPVLGLVLGGVLGVFDGLSALLSAPEVAPDILGIVIGSTFKGVVAGALTGWVATKYKSMPVGLVAGLAATGRQPLLARDHAAGQRPRPRRRLRDTALRPVESSNLLMCWPSLRS